MTPTAPDSAPDSSSGWGGPFGYKALLPILEKNEEQAVQNYTGQMHASTDPALSERIGKMIADERGHSVAAAVLDGRVKAAAHDVLAGERWHRGGSSIRDVIFGMNDGLLSTFSLVTGVSGAGADNRLVLISGLAGAVAGAISMAAGAFVSTKSEREVYQHHLEIERTELATMPEEEEAELALLYRLRGIPDDQARTLAKRLLEDEETALESMAREELGLQPGSLPNPSRAGLDPGSSFIIGAAVPILPYVIIGGNAAMLLSIGLSLLGFFVIGAGRTLVTGRNAWRSGLEMLLIGSGAAVVTYLIGSMLGVSLAD